MCIDEDNIRKEGILRVSIFSMKQKIISNLYSLGVGTETLKRKFFLIKILICLQVKYSKTLSSEVLIIVVRIREETNVDEGF